MIKPPYRGAADPFLCGMVVMTTTLNKNGLMKKRSSIIAIRFGPKSLVALTDDRKYLFLTISYNISLEAHAQNIIDLGRAWGLNVDRAMRFDGGESAYMAFRMGDKMVPILDLEEPLIVNCLTVEAK